MSFSSCHGDPKVIHFSPTIKALEAEEMIHTRDHKTSYIFDLWHFGGLLLQSVTPIVPGIFSPIYQGGSLSLAAGPWGAPVTVIKYIPKEPVGLLAIWRMMENAHPA